MSVRKIGCVVSGKTALGWMEQFFKTLPALVFLVIVLFVRNKQSILEGLLIQNYKVLLFISLEF